MIKIKHVINSLLFHIQSFLWFLLFFYFKNRYGIKVAKTQIEKEKIFEFRYNIYNAELNYVWYQKLSHERKIYDEFDFMENTYIFYSGDINHITGTIRLTVWNKRKLPKYIQEKYYITQDLLPNVEYVGVLSFFQVKKNYRKNSLLGLTLISYLWKFKTEHQAEFFPDMIFFDCLPGLLKQYNKMGCFTYTDKIMFAERAILEVPLAIAPFDVHYLKKQQCINYYLVKYYFNQYKKLVPDAEVVMKSRSFESIVPHLWLYKNRDELNKYHNAISSEKLKKLFHLIVSLQENNLVISIGEGTPIIQEKVIDYYMYLLIEGAVGIYIGDKLISKLFPGA